MDFQADFVKVKDLVDKAAEILIVTHERPTFDSIGSSLALSLGLAGLGKRVTIACPDPITVELSSFVGVNKVSSDLAKKNFIISLDYVDGSIEKVSYNIEGNKFNLVIEPRPGFESFSPDKVSYSYGGGNAELILAVDTIHLGGLKQIYEANKELFSTRPVINVDHHPNNSHFGAHNIVDPSASSTAELTAQLLSSLGVALTVDIATNLLNALYGATNSFQGPSVSSSAFEVAAVCVKAGGKRFSKISPAEEVPTRETVADVGVPKPSVKQQQKAAPQPQPQAPAGQAPADWLKPKIFKSSNLV